MKYVAIVAFVVFGILLIVYPQIGLNNGTDMGLYIKDERTYIRVSRAMGYLFVLCAVFLGILVLWRLVSGITH